MSQCIGLHGFHLAINDGSSKHVCAISSGLLLFTSPGIISLSFSSLEHSDSDLLIAK